MNINLIIERLILDGLHTGAGHGVVVKSAVEAELSRLLTHGGVAPGLQSGGAFPSVHARSIQVSAEDKPTQLGRQIARAVYGGIGEGTYSKRPLSSPSTGFVQSTKGPNQNEEERCGLQQTIQRKAAKYSDLPEVPPLVHEVLNSPGQPLDTDTRAFFEPRFGYNFSQVRVHADSKAAESAQAVNASAYTVGRNLVFAAERYAPTAATGHRLLAHELAHVVQQNGMHVPGAKLTISAPDDTAEREAEHMADSISRGNTIAGRPTSVPTKIQRMVFVKPAAAASDILGQFNKMCPGKFGIVAAAKAAQITADCKASDRSKNKSCECLCDTAHDKKRQYSITVKPAVKSIRKMTVVGATSDEDVPHSSVYPNTIGGDHPRITMPASKGSDIEFGAFKSDGRSPIWCDNWRILAHELCGHGRLRQTHAPQPRGCRPKHNDTIDTENTIAGEHGGDKRGKFNDRPRQGESFYNPVGDRSKIVFELCDGLHFEKP